MTITQDCNCTLQIVGTLPEEYVKAVNADLKNFAYEDSVSLNFAYSVDTSGNKDSLNKDSDGYTLPYSTSVHLKDNILNIDQFEISNVSDGLYKIVSLVFPTKEFIYNFLDLLNNTTATELQTYLTNKGYDYNLTGNCKYIVVYNTETDLFEQLATYGIGQTLKWQVISTTDISDLVDNCALNYMTVMTDSVQYLSYCALKNCYITRAQKMLDIYNGNSSDSSSVISRLCSSSVICENDGLKKYKNEILIRDYLWMAINVIKYLIECGDYTKALKTLNCTQACSGICSSTTNYSNTSSSNGCGCS